MKRRNNYLDIILAAFICILIVSRFIFFDVGVADSSQPEPQTKIVNSEFQTDDIENVTQEEKSKDITVITNNNMIDTNLTEQEKDIWEKISLDCSGGIAGIEVHDYDIEVRQDDWVYVVKGAEISKTRKETWDFVPDYDKYEYDEQENLINEYSYVSVLVNITRVDTERHSEGYVNSIGLGIYNEQGERVGGGEAKTSDLGNPHTSSYFCHGIELGESRDVEIVYIIEDCDLEEDNYYIIEVDNRGVTPQAPDHISLIRVPLGKSVLSEEQERVENSETSLNAARMTQGIWERISLRASSGIAGIEVHDYGTEVRQDDWVYVVKGAEISKTRKETWDFVPDYDKYEYDEQENLINEYSYVSVLVNITRVDTERHSEGYVNSIWLGIFDEDAERVGGGEVRTADLNNSHTSSYFCHAIELGESRDVEIVYMIEDCDLQENNYYLIKVNNRGVAPQAPDHISLVKIPLGKSIEN